MTTLNGAAVSTELFKIKGDVKNPLMTLTVTTLRVFRLHLSVLLPFEWWERGFLNHSNKEAVLIKRQPGDSLRTTKPNQPSLVDRIPTKGARNKGAYRICGYGQKRRERPTTGPLHKFGKWPALNSHAVTYIGRHSRILTFSADSDLRSRILINELLWI